MEGIVGRRRGRTALLLIALAALAAATTAAGEELTGVMRDLLAESGDRVPTAASIRDRFKPNASSVTTAGEDLSIPSWAESAHSARDTYLELAGELFGMQVWEDSRGWGTYVQIFPRVGVLADVEAIVGPTEPVPRAPDDFDSGDIVVAYLDRLGASVRVFVELKDAGPELHSITIHFQH